ncbi:hypothetical protein Tco_1306969, partial [Tanacetum coccineum]
MFHWLRSNLIKLKRFQELDMQKKRHIPCTKRECGYISDRKHASSETGLQGVRGYNQGNRVQATVKNQYINKFQLLIERVENFDNNTRGFKFEPFSNFTARTFGENEVVDVIGTNVSILDAIPFNSFGPDKIRRTLILEDVEYAEIDGYDPQNMTISLFFPVKKDLTPEESCKKCGRIAKEIYEVEAASIPRNNMRPQLWNCKVHKGITAVGIRYKQYGEDYDGYFPSELNGIVGEKLLFRFHYTDYNINNNNHVYQVQRISHDEAIINVFKKDFISEDVVDDLLTPISKDVVV